MRKNLRTTDGNPMKLQTLAQYMDSKTGQLMKVYSIDDLANLLYDNKIKQIQDNLCRTDDAYALVSGIKDHLFFGNDTDLNGKPLPFGYGHTYKCFHKYNESTKQYEIPKFTKNGTYNGDYLRSFHEMIADYISYQFSPNKSSIKAIRAILGQDLINELDKIYQELLNYA